MLCVENLCSLATMNGFDKLLRLLKLENNRSDCPLRLTFSFNWYCSKAILGWFWKIHLPNHVMRLLVKTMFLLNTIQLWICITLIVNCDYLMCLKISYLDNCYIVFSLGFTLTGVIPLMCYFLISPFALISVDSDYLISLTPGPSFNCGKEGQSLFWWLRSTVQT